MNERMTLRMNLILVALLLLNMTVWGISTNCTGPVDWTTGFGLFAESNWPGGCWRPYSENSVWNYRLPENPKLHPSSDAMVARTLSLGNFGKLITGTSGKSLDYSKPTYYSQSTDPLFTVHCTEPWGTCAVEGARIRIPDAAEPAAGSDAHMTVVDQTTNWEYDFWEVQHKETGGGQLNIGWGGRTLISGNGLDSSATAANYGNLAGIIRAEELEAGAIHHALFLVIKCGGKDPVTGKASFIYPATKGDQICSDPSSAPPMGSHFYLAMSDEEINGLTVPQWKKTIFFAMAHYGLYMGDTGGPGFGLQLESGATYTSFGASDKTLDFAKANGWLKADNSWAAGTEWENTYSGDVESGVDWRRYLKLLDPCVSQRNCVSSSVPSAAPSVVPSEISPVTNSSDSLPSTSLSFRRINDITGALVLTLVVTLAVSANVL
jgi:hypothetical protein